MNTTTLYAEIIVVGSGTTMFIVLFFYSLFGKTSWFSNLGGLSSVESIVSLIPVLSVFYLLGIIITNLGHLFFKTWEDGLRKEKLSDLKREYEDVRTDLFTSSDKDLIEQFEFRRSKIRICRGWFINSILILVTLLISPWTGKIPEAIVWFWVIIVWLLMNGIRVSWLNATNTELAWLRSFAKQKKPESKSGSGVTRGKNAGERT
jgi:hypothetical protein